MDKLSKSLERLSVKEKKQIKQILNQLSTKQFIGLNIKKLKGREDIFRVRKGNLRIIYRIEKEEIFILTVERRSEKTYRDY